MRLAGGLSSAREMIRSVVLNTVLAVIILAALHFGPIGTHQFLFDRLVQPPSGAFVSYPGE